MGAVTLLLLTLVGLLAVVAVASSGHHPLAGDRVDAAPADAFWDYTFTLVVALALPAVAIAVWALVTSRKRVPLGPRSQAGPYLLIAAFILFAVFGGRAIERAFERGPDELSLPPDLRQVNPTTTSVEPTQYTPEVQWPLLIALASLAVLTAAGFTLYGRHRRTGAGADDELAEELAALVDEALGDLRQEADPRRAVIAAYARMERALAGHGLPRHAFEAPLEYLERVSSHLQEAQPLARRLVFELTYLYERAKFSQHDIDMEMKEGAIGALEAIRAELGVRT
jgi:hypothetical protein